MRIDSKIIFENDAIVPVIKYARRVLGLLYSVVCRNCGNPVADTGLGNLCFDCWLRIPELKGNLCPKCSLPLKSANAFCPDCRGLNPCFDKVFSLMPYLGLSKELIHDLKYQSVLSLLRPLAKMLATLILGNSFYKYKAVISIDADDMTYRQRGHDHVRDLSKRLAGHLNIKCGAGWLLTKPKVIKQNQLSRKERLKNVKNIFVLKKTTEIKDSALLLLDDVFTTGATANAAATVLKKAGAAKVDVITLARSI
jgi:competence protein ComFC